MKNIEANTDIITVPRGTSMWPLIRNKKDMVIVEPVSGELMVGDIILFKRSDGQSVMHRVWKISPDRQKLQTYGDNCCNPDEPIDINDVRGVVTEIKRGNKVITSLRSDECNGAAYGCFIRTVNRPLRLIKKVINIFR